MALLLWQHLKIEVTQSHGQVMDQLEFALFGQGVAQLKHGPRGPVIQAKAIYFTGSTLVLAEFKSPDKIIHPYLIAKSIGSVSIYQRSIAPIYQ